MKSLSLAAERGRVANAAFVIVASASLMLSLGRWLGRIVTAAKQFCRTVAFLSGRPFHRQRLIREAASLAVAAPFLSVGWRD